MWQYNRTCRLELYHHGILGMKWGKRNGPPYPLGASAHSNSEKKAGWRKSLDRTTKKAHTVNGNGETVSKLTKSRMLDSLIDKGKQATDSLLAKHGDKTVEQLCGSTKSSHDTQTINIGKQAADAMMGKTVSESVGGIKKLSKPETLAETLKRANPLNGTEEGYNNCVPSAIAGFLRQAGYDVTAKGTPGRKMLNPAGVVEECFKGVKVLEGSAVKFGKSRQAATEMLVKRYGQNAEGICGINWKGGGGHCFSWKIKDGVVEFFDCQKGRRDSDASKYFSLIDPNGQLVLARLDGLEINMDTIHKYVKR